MVIFSHHAIQSLTCNIPDESALACTADDAHGHDVNPGCDVDPRSSSPIHLGADATALLHQFPNVIAWVAGHSHVNDVTPYPDGRGGGFWMIRTAAEADWPQQSRLLQIFDNHDGTLSIFGTVPRPRQQRDRADLDLNPPPRSLELASVGRTLSYNDTQKGARECTPNLRRGPAKGPQCRASAPQPAARAAAGAGQISALRNGPATRPAEQRKPQARRLRSRWRTTAKRRCRRGRASSGPGRRPPEGRARYRSAVRTRRRPLRSAPTPRPALRQALRTPRRRTALSGPAGNARVDLPRGSPDTVQFTLTRQSDDVVYEATEQTPGSYSWPPACLDLWPER